MKLSNDCEITLVLLASQWSYIETSDLLVFVVHKTPGTRAAFVTIYNKLDLFLEALKGLA